MTQKGYLPISIKVFKEGTSKDVPYVAYAPELDMSAAGKNPHSARKALQGVIEYLLKQREKEGKLETFLRELGFKGLGKKEKLEPPEVSFIQIPFRFSTFQSMPKIAPTGYKTQKKVFEKMGFVHVRTKGDHLILEKTGVLRPIVIPAYKEVPVFIIKNNLRTANLTNKEYFQILGKNKIKK